MSTTPTTPRTRTTFSSTTPTTPRVVASHAAQPSPHYPTTRRHSLYGVEDRVVIDPGSRIWKVGFSGEGRPRDVFLADRNSGASLWDLQRVMTQMGRAEEEKLLEVKLQRCLRSVFHDSLLTDPKARKVILVEHPLMPLYIKDIIARILFENHVPSVSFAPSHLLSLLAVGRITGLVLDCGHLESVALPIFAARPLYVHLKTTPMGGKRLTSHLRALLLMFGTYIPPPTSLSTAISIPSTNRATRVPPEVLTDLLVEDIKTRCCFVGNLLGAVDAPNPSAAAEDNSSEFDVPPSSDTIPLESGFTQVEYESSLSSQRDTSEFSAVSGVHHGGPAPEEGHLQALANLYSRYSSATDLRMPVNPPLSQQTGTGKGTLIIPGWVRERAAEVLFEGGDIDESSLAENILDALLKVPLDLRKTFASSILVSGGTAMLPGFIPRLHATLVQALSPRLAQPPRDEERPRRTVLPPHDAYATLRPLLPYLSILNNPSPPPPLSDRAHANAGKAPAFSPGALAWVGGSLAGALKTGGTEVVREKWDEINAVRDQDESMDLSLDSEERSIRNILPDWTRTILPVGAPPANINRTLALTEVSA